MKIAVLEDDISLNETIKETLEILGYEVDTFFNGNDIIPQKYDLYLLDINVPGINGLELLDYLKFDKVIIMSSNISEMNIVKAYKNGVIDFIKKPFFMAEIEAKLLKIFPKKEKISDNCFYDRDKKVLIKNNKEEIKLSKREWKIVELFLKNRNKIISYEEIINFVYEKEPSHTAIRTAISRIKNKSKLDIENIPKEGYILNI